ncbi:class I SAM-dependent methyltransferase [Microvirga sp. GCM10011540]|uniref:class I SAM-dependent methyltransferase n=1 Tax=Microvirga sp. GCM10011540 TaxID=3317338 RepID=UPI00360F2406
MTRLDSAIRRLTAQRDLLDWASREIAPAGLVLEVGLGNGRTYDHLRSRLPGRKIYVFERSPAAHPDCMPPEEKLIVGDVFETLPSFTQRIGEGVAALIHIDIGTGDETRNREVARRLSPLLEALLQPGGLLLGDRAFDLPSCTDISSEIGVAQGRYFVYRRDA